MWSVLQLVSRIYCIKPTCCQNNPGQSLFECICINSNTYLPIGVFVYSVPCSYVPTDFTRHWKPRTFCQLRRYWWHRRFSLWASCQIRKIAGCACAGNAGNVFPRRRLQRKPLVSDPGMHHGTCVTHVPWCMSGSLTRGGGENVPGIPGACAPTILSIW